MSKHIITTRAQDKLGPQTKLVSYYCVVCGRNFGEMTFEQSQLINMDGCSAKIVEHVPSPFWIRGEQNPDVDTGHNGLMDDLEILLREADQYAFHDKKNKKYPMPKVALIKTLEDMIERAKRGYYDNL